jgi:transcriptional regulator with XRE-family HTH domain
MARRQVTSRSIARKMGWSEIYMSRRLTGSVPFNVTDLAAIADLLDVPVATFFETARVRCPGT